MGPRWTVKTGVIGGTVLLGVASASLLAARLWSAGEAKSLLAGMRPVHVGLFTDRLPNWKGAGEPSYQYFREFVDAYLLAAGVPVARAEDETGKGKPFWQINISLTRAEEWTAYTTRFEWMEDVRTVRTRERAWTSFWTSGGFGITNSAEPGEAIKASMRPYLDAFVAEYLRANPDLVVTARR